MAFCGIEGVEQEADGVPGRKGRCEELLNIGEEQLSVHRAIDHAGRIDPVVAQAGDEGGGLPVIVRHGHRQPLAALRPAMTPGHVGGGTRLGDEHQPFRVQLALALAPGLPRGGDIGPFLLGGMCSLFYASGRKP